MKKMKMTVGQAVVKFLNQQYIEMDGKEEAFVDGVAAIFGHGMVVGLGQGTGGGSRASEGVSGTQ